MTDSNMPQREIGDQRQFDERPSWARYAVLGWFCFAATIAYVCRNSIGVAESTIRKDLELTESQMGDIMLAFFLTYALAQVPSGWLAFRMGTRRLLPCLAIGWSIATATLGLATGFVTLVLARLFNGLVQAGIFPCTTNSVAKWFPSNERAIASGALGAFMSLGGALGAVSTGALLGVMNWRAVFILFGLPGVIWAVGFYLWFRELPWESRWVNDAERRLIRGDSKIVDDQQPANIATPWMAILTSTALWLICGQQFFRAAGYIFFATWFPTYLQETRAVSVEQSGFLTSLPMISIVAGALLGGVVSDWILRRTNSRRLARKGVAATALLGCAAMIGIAYFVANPLLASGVIAVGTFLAAFAGPCAYTITIDMGGRHVAPVFGMMNMVGNLGAMLFPWFTPRYKNFIEGHPELMEFFGNSSWDSVLVMFGLIYVGAAVCWMLLNPDGAITDYSIYRPAGRTTLKESP